MSPVKPKKLEKPSIPKQKYTITQQQITFKINRKFVIVPTEKRAQYVELLDKMIQRVVEVINSRRTKTKTRLRAMGVLSNLIKTSYGMVRDEEVEQLEQEVEELEEEAQGTSKTENSTK